MSVRITWYSDSAVVHEECSPSVLAARAKALKCLRAKCPHGATAVRVWDDRTVYFQIAKGLPRSKPYGV